MLPCLSGEDDDIIVFSFRFFFNKTIHACFNRSVATLKIIIKLAVFCMFLLLIISFLFVRLFL